MTCDLAVAIGKLKLKNPVIVASGTFGYGEEFHGSIYDISKLGAIVTKGISLKSRRGNPTPRIVETASGMLNAIGLANVGVEIFIDEKLPFLKKTGATVIVNIFGETLEEYAEIANRLNEVDGINAIELNISCPNVKAGGVQFGMSERLAASVTGVVRKNYKGVLIVKLSPQVADIKAMAVAVESSGADAVSLINTFPAMAIDAKTRKPILANITGGLSGPAIKPIALKMVRDVFSAVKIPVIGLGGIMSATDAVEFMLAGARAIQIGTANFVKPKIAMEIVEGLKTYCKESGFEAIIEAVGALEES